MKMGMGIGGIVVLWSLVVGMIMLVDPILVRDIGWTGAYLPMTFLLGTAIVYTVGWWSKSWLKGLIAGGLGLLAWYLAINELLYWFVGVGIILLGIVILTFTKQS